MCVLSVEENCDIVTTHGANIGSSDVVSMKQYFDVVEMTQICLHMLIMDPWVKWSSRHSLY